MLEKNFAKYLLIITLGHILVGLILFWPYLIEIPLKGWVNVIGPEFIEGSVAVWFLLFSWPLILIVINFWKSKQIVQNSFLYVCIFGSLLGISLMPASGFWLLLMLSGYATIKNMKTNKSRSELARE